MNGSAGNLVAQELHRRDHRGRGADGARSVAAGVDDEVLDPQSFPAITTDGPVPRPPVDFAACYASQPIAPAQQAEPAADELAPLRSRIERLESAVQVLLQERHDRKGTR